MKPAWKRLVSLIYVHNSSADLKRFEVIPVPTRVPPWHALGLRSLSLIQVKFWVGVIRLTGEDLQRDETQTQIQNLSVTKIVVYVQ